MREKKQFFIPKNYDKKFEWIPGISGWQHVAFIPVIALDYVILQHTPFSFSNKITFIVITLGLPWVLIGTHPVRENVSLYKHLVWRLKFLNRQRIFKYRKEGYVDAIQNEKEREVESERTEKTRGIVKEINPRHDSSKGNSKRIANNTRQEDDSVSKSISN